jgi:hypothetical protein
MERRLMPALNWDEIPDEPVRPGESPGSEVVESIDVLAPARDDYLHLLRWMR